MIRINLLPHREEKRRARRTQFYAVGAAMVVLGALVVVLVHGIIGGYIGAQESKNEFLKREIAALDKEIAEIKRLQEQTEALLSRKQVIESLQAHRTETVHLFGEMVRHVPEGTYLKSLKQSGQKVTLAGYAQSNARVSTLMRNVDGSPYLEQPNLIEIKAATVGNRRVSEFSLDLRVTRAKQEDAAKGGSGKPGATPAAQAKKS